MKELLVILLFGKTILLNQSPVDIQTELLLNLENPISALTSGASLQIDVSSMISYSSGEDMKLFSKKLLGRFPANSIKGELISNNGDKTLIYYDGGHRFNNKEVLLSLNSDQGIDPDKEFIKIKLYSEINLNSVDIYWDNYKK